MRDIRFRAWNTIDKVMITDLNSVQIRHGVVKADPDDILMQYIGLEDYSENKVAVYEGDIVKVWHDDYPEEFQIGKVWWFDCYYPAFDIYILNKKTGTGFESYSDEFNSFSCPNYTFEVIGNIHQHPELLGEGHE